MELMCIIAQAYHNDKNWKQVFWGVNYPKLSQIKTKFDPNMTFWVSPGISADQMRVVRGRLCKAANKAATTSRLTTPLTDSKNSANIMDRELFGTSEIISDFPKPGAQI